MKAFLRSVGMVSLLRMAVEMLLPTGATRRMCQTLLGLMTSLTMLAALRGLLQGWMDENGFGPGGAGRFWRCCL